MIAIFAIFGYNECTTSHLVHSKQVDRNKKTEIKRALPKVWRRWERSSEIRNSAFNERAVAYSLDNTCCAQQSQTYTPYGTCHVAPLVSMARVAFFVFSNGGDMERASTLPVRKLNKSFWQGVRITPVQRDKLVKLAGAMGKSVTVSDAIRNLIDSANIDIRGGHGE